VRHKIATSPRGGVDHQRAEVSVDQMGEAPPRGRTTIELQTVEPELGIIKEIEGCIGYPFCDLECGRHGNSVRTYSARVADRRCHRTWKNQACDRSEGNRHCQDLIRWEADVNMAVVQPSCSQRHRSVGTLGCWSVAVGGMEIMSPGRSCSVWSRAHFW
jgi:hypothetical protein